MRETSTGTLAWKRDKSGDGGGGGGGGGGFGGERVKVTAVGLARLSTWSSHAYVLYPGHNDTESVVQRQ